jgi:Ca-activated chloride channel family protein
MIFEWPQALWLLAVVPILAAGYRILRERQALKAAAYAQWGGASAALPSRLRRVLPPTLYLVAIVALITAMARPVAVIALPSLRETVILAIDVSNSMLAEDVEPTRLEAAQAAAREFIDRQPLASQIGIVAFAETALLIQRPTDNRAELMKAIDRLKPQDGTAVGGAILVALQALFPKETLELELAQDGERRDAPDDGADAPPPPEPKSTPGSETSSAIVLLTDGQTTSGPDPLQAAQLAADRGVRVFTVGLGTASGAVVKAKGISMRVQLDEETLKKVADLTLGRYFLAGDGEALSEVYRELSTRLVTDVKETEIAAVFVALAAAAALTAAALSLLWFNRVL